MVFNLLLEEIGEKTYRLIMPDESGEMKQKIEKGHAIHWPVNPHFTGDWMIKSMLEQVDLFAGCKIV